MRLIDADKLWLVTDGDHEYYEKFEIDDAPTVDAEPVRHGKWWRYPLSQAGFPDHIYMMRQCSECKKAFDQKWNYCPNCGAKMDAERKEE